MKNRAVFFDKDGTLIHNVPYNIRPELIQLMPGASETVSKLKNSGYKLLVVSNQSGVGRGFFQESDLILVWKRLNELCGIEFDGFYFCPHHPDDLCTCRKPNAEMLYRAAREHELDLEKSWIIGDILNDVEAGRRAGCQTILFDVGNETEWILNETRQPHFTITNLNEAASIIMANG